jgi:deoxyribodipyrimidine photo-lyase
VGDGEQLKSVENGAVLPEIASLRQSGVKFPIVTLTENRRQMNAPGGKLNRIGVLAEMMRAPEDKADPGSDIDAIFEFLRINDKEITWIELDDDDASPLIPSLVLEKIDDDLNAFTKAKVAAQAGKESEALDHLARIRVLCGHRVGRFGVKEWNSALGKHLEIPLDRTSPGLPLLNTKNEVRTGLVNGDTGIVASLDGTPYAVFTPFRRRWREHLGGAPLIEAPVDPTWADGVAGTVPSGDGAWPWGDAVGEPPSDGVAVDVDTAAALVRWRRFVATGLDRYGDRRNDPADAGTSMMSTALRFGLVHPARLLADLDPADEQHQTFESELTWRDFYADGLHRRPDSAWANLDRRLDGIVVDTDATARDRLDRWRSGTTGFEIVDAGMRQLAATGWMHNRVRMIAASFLVKDLHLPWQWGARHFMETLVDGDLASNNHGWQWAAGTGTDAAPYFRVFNPVAQAERWDPNGEYRARWLPELGTSAYPAPMVDHAAERAEALRRYEAARRA